MRLGIFARTFSRPTLVQVLQAVRAHGLNLVHFNLVCAGLETLPRTLTAGDAGRIATAFHRCGVEMLGVSGTFNAIHPEPDVRRELTQRCCQLISLAPQMGMRLVTLCTGTRDPADMWRAHRDNALPPAWRDLTATLERLIAAADEADVALGIEPETGNVINSASAARRLLDEMRCDRLKIIFDGANLLRDCRNQSQQRDILAAAIELLAPDIAVVHAKEIPSDPVALDFELYFQLLRSAGFDGPVVLHGLAEAEVNARVRSVRDMLRAKRVGE